MRRSLWEPEIEQLLSELQSDRAKDRLSTIQKLAKLEIDDERIAVALETIAFQDPTQYVREEAQAALRAPTYQAILRRRKEAAAEQTVEHTELATAPERETVGWLRDVLDVFLKLSLVAFLLFVLLVVVIIFFSNNLHQPATGLGGVGMGNGQVAIEASANDRCPSDGQVVTVQATVMNRTIQPLVFELNDQPVFDLGVTERFTKNTPTRWSDGKALTRDLTRLELQPGQSKMIQMDWKAYNSGGPYDATATLDYSSLFQNAMNKYDHVASAYVSFGSGPHECVLIDLP